MRITSFYIALLLILGSNTSTAGVIFVPVGGRIVDSGQSRVEHKISGVLIGLKIQSVGLSSSGSIQNTPDTPQGGLELGQDFSITEQELSLKVDLTTGKLNGQIRGRIIGLLEQPLKFKARIQGDGQCIEPQENSCTTLAVDMRIKGVLISNINEGIHKSSVMGKLELDMIGDFFTGNEAFDPTWRALDFSGRVGLRN